MRLEYHRGSFFVHVMAVLLSVFIALGSVFWAGVVVDEAEEAIAELVSAEVSRSEDARSELEGAESAIAGLESTERAIAELVSAERVTAGRVRAKVERTEARSQWARAELARAELARTELEIAELEKAELARAEEARAEEARAEEARAELTRAEKARAELEGTDVMEDVGVEFWIPVAFSFALFIFVIFYPLFLITLNANHIPLLAKHNRSHKRGEPAVRISIPHPSRNLIIIFTILGFFTLGLGFILAVAVACGRGLVDISTVDAIRLRQINKTSGALPELSEE